jgi:3'-phosphoadenosine 5'-phosphosulfate sulfotransferase (PAPS reductase)/FAD synthetase
MIRALDGLAAWVTSLRRWPQTLASVHPSTDERIEIDTVHHNIVKLNPLAGWSEEQVWSYITRHQLPYNELDDRRYRSIGCARCTRPTNPGEDLCAGRWLGRKLQEGMWTPHDNGGSEGQRAGRVCAARRRSTHQHIAHSRIADWL